MSDTLYIDEVSVVSSATGKYQVGVRSKSFSSDVLESHGSGNLSSLISQHMTVYVKSDAGGLGSIRIRGTAPDHTAVMIGGLNINSLTLGYSNSSSVPTYLFDDITVQLGNSSAEVGSGAIGGTVKLGLNNQWTDGVKARAFGAAGSYGEYLGGGKFYWGNGKFEHVLRFYDYRKENDFTYTYEYRGQEHEAVQKYTAVHNQGLLNELNYKFSDKEYITSFVWLESSVHDKQPSISDNNEGKPYPGALENCKVLSWVEYNNKKNPLSYKLGGGYVKDNQIDNGNNDQTIGTERVEFDAQVFRDFEDYGKLNGGLHYRYIVPNVYAYEDDLTEQQMDLHLSYTKTFFSNLQMSANIRQQWITDFEAPLTPSLGLNYSDYIGERSMLSILGNASRSYRVPTFNDRFWGVDSMYVGNPNLKAEEGYSYELGLKYMYSSDHINIKSHLQGFWMDIDDWIMWLPQGAGWEAVNIQRVLSRGIETINSIGVDFNDDWKASSGLNYTFNPVNRKESDNPGDNLDMQLEYAPKHLGYFWVNTTYKSTEAGLSFNYVGQRNVTQVGDVLDDYLLMNLDLSQEFKRDNSTFRVGINAENLLNTSYQNQLNYAMPGRSFRITLNYKFK